MEVRVPSARAQGLDHCVAEVQFWSPSQCCPSDGHLPGGFIWASLTKCVFHGILLGIQWVNGILVTNINQLYIYIISNWDVSANGIFLRKKNHESVDSHVIFVV